MSTWLEFQIWVSKTSSIIIKPHCGESDRMSNNVSHTPSSTSPWMAPWSIYKRRKSWATCALVLACTAGSDTVQSWWKPTLEACPSLVGLLVTTGCPCVVEAARLVGPAMQGVIAGFTASRSNRALLAVFVLCSLYALYLLGDSLTPKNMCVPPWLPGRVHCSCFVSCCVVVCVGCCVGPMPSMRPGSWVVFVHCSAYDPTRKFLRDPTPAGNTPMVDEAALLAGPGHHASHTSALVSSSFNTAHDCGYRVCGVGDMAHRRAGAVTGMWVALRWTTCTGG